MFSGKSTELLRRMRSYESNNKQIYLITSSRDTRYTNNEAVVDIITHNK